MFLFFLFIRFVKEQKLLIGSTIFYFINIYPPFTSEKKKKLYSSTQEINAHTHTYI